MIMCCSCKPKSTTVDTWKAFVISRTDVEGYKDLDLIDQWIDERIGTIEFINYYDRFEDWLMDSPEAPYFPYDNQEDTKNKLKKERKDFADYYGALAELTLINTLATDNDVYVDEDYYIETLVDDLFSGLLGALLDDYYILQQWMEEVAVNVDLNKLGEITSDKLKDNMIGIIGSTDDYSLYEDVLELSEIDENKLWDAENISVLANTHPDEFFNNVKLVLSDYSGLYERINNTVSVFICEYNYDLSTSNTDVYDVIYSIKDKMYVKCTILETDKRSEIKIVSQSPNLLSL